MRNARLLCFFLYFSSVLCWRSGVQFFWGCQQVFWYNPKTEAHSWNPPQEVIDMQNASQGDFLATGGNNLPTRGDVSNSGAGDGQAKFGSAQWKSLHMGSMRLKKVGAWYEAEQ